MAHGDSRTVNLRDGKPPSSKRGPAPHGAMPMPRISKIAREFRAPVVPGYEIVTELGRGGMGIVYKAIQAGLNRSVALKMVLAGLHADKDDLQRFLDEAAAVARLQHPNIVQIISAITTACPTRGSAPMAGSCFSATSIALMYST